jgi:hypothetical protein
LRTEAGIEFGLKQHDLLSLLAVVVCDGEEVKSLSTSDSSVTEIEFSHSQLAKRGS